MNDLPANCRGDWAIQDILDSVFVDVPQHKRRPVGRLKAAEEDKSVSSNLK
jgi:hypothetical protein